MRRDRSPDTKRSRELSRGAKALATVLCSPEDATSSVKQLASSLASPPFFKNSKKRSRDERSSDGYSEYRRRHAAHREKEKPRTSSSKQQKLKTVLRHTIHRRSSRSSSRNDSTSSSSESAAHSTSSMTSRKDVQSIISGADDDNASVYDRNPSNGTNENENEFKVNKVLQIGKAKMSDAKVISILNRAEKGELDSFLMTDPPFKPKGGEMFLCLSQHSTDWDYRRDGYFGLKCRGDNKDSINTDLHRFYCKYVDEKKQIIKGFERDEYCLRDSLEKKPRIILTHYRGSHEIWKPRAHGNSKSGKIFTANTSKAKKNINKKLEDTGKKSEAVYEMLLKDASKRPDFFEREAVIVTRDRKQVENQLQKQQQAKRILRDEFFAAYEMIRSNRFAGFLKLFLVPDEAFVLAEPQTIQLATNLLQEAHKNPMLPQCICYDTTFNVLDGYVSPMVMRNTYIQGSPTFVVAILIHEKKTEMSHDVFWREMVEILFVDPLPDTVPICTDREKGITNAIIKRLGENVKQVYCNNHIIRDAKHWVQNAPGKRPDDVTILPKEIDTILKSDTEQEFHDNYEYFSGTWSVPFKEYVDKHLKDDMQNHAAFFYTKQFPAFSDRDATNNASEGCHSVIKRRADYETLRIDSAILMLFNFQLSQLQEFSRAYSGCGLGKFVLNSEYEKTKQPFTLPTYAYWTEDEFIEVFKEGLYKPGQNVEKEGNFLQGKSALAKLACQMQYVSLNSQTVTYVVTDPYSGDRNTVEEIDGKLKCTCHDTGVCFHKVAYLHVTKKEIIEDRATWKLSELRKRTRKFKGRSGKKGLTKEDFYDVIEAPDSQISRKRQDMDEFISSEEENLVVKAAVNPRANYCIPGSQMSGSKIIPSNVAVSEDESKDTLEEQSCAKLSQDTASTVTTTLSVSSDGRTPEEFRLRPSPPVVNKNLYTTPTYSCLKPGAMLMTDIVDDMIALLIVIHDMEGRVSFADSVMWEKVQESLADSKRNCSFLQALLVVEPLNSSIMFVNIRIDMPPHFLLGVVLFDDKKIVLVNSLPNCPTDVKPILRSLMHLVRASYSVAGLKFDPMHWKFYNESESSIQVGGSDCGLFVIINALSILRRRPFLTSENTPASDHMRAWVLSCLTHESVNKPVELKAWKRSKRLPRSGREKLCDSLLITSQLEDINVEFQSMASTIHCAIREPNFSNGTCTNSSCPGDRLAGSRSVMCVNCRSWYHVGVCVASTVVKEIFYICSLCEAQKL